MITPAEFERRMSAIAHPKDRPYYEEEAHIEADELMEELLIELGYGAGIEVFRAMSKWYS